MNLEDWLDHCERLHPHNIDMGLERVQKVAQRLHWNWSCPVITVAGTNGKGSTCAMIEAVCRQSGYRTGVYTSPHLVHFEERCRIQGQSVAAQTLVPHFERVERARQGENLTYFEFTTLAILDLLCQSELDVVVLEVGLGGRLDAVNVVDADAAVVTCIDVDHTEWLGPDRESIGREKVGIARAGRPLIVSDPVPPASVLAHANAIGADLWVHGRDFHFSGERHQWHWIGRERRYHGLAYPALRGANQLLNASGVLALFEALRQRLPVTAQSVRNGLALVELPGRFQTLAGQPTLVLDVAHNPHSVAALFQNLDAMGFCPQTHAVFGAMADKDLDAMLTRMIPLVTHWHVCDLPSPRAARAHDLASILKSMAGVAAQQVFTHDSPAQALAVARENADPTDRIVVFGSFLTVGGVIENGLPNLNAPHLSN
jgi:dihydrofolate synthase/folylpolyglutamate synthase